MNIVEMYEMVKRIYIANEDKYYYIGLRFENKQRVIGDTCECSRHNIDRDDEREFPNYDTEEYEEMFEFDGTSAWDMSVPSTYKINRGADLEKDCSRHFDTDHCYVIAGKSITNQDDGLDVGEIVIKDAVVIAQIF